MYQVLVFKFRRHLCKGSIVGQNFYLRLFACCNFFFFLDYSINIDKGGNSLYSEIPLESLNIVAGFNETKQT